MDGEVTVWDVVLVIELFPSGLACHPVVDENCPICTDTPVLPVDTVTVSVVVADVQTPYQISKLGFDALWLVALAQVAPHPDIEEMVIPVVFLPIATITNLPLAVDDTVMFWAAVEFGQTN